MMMVDISLNMLLETHIYSQFKKHFVQEYLRQGS